LPERLIDRVADGLKPGSRAATLSLDDLVFHDDAELTARTRLYLSAAMNGRESSGLEMEARAILLVARLLSHHGYAPPTAEAKGGLAPWQINWIGAFLSDAPEQSITLDALAGQVGLSPFHFARAFKASKGVRPIVTWYSCGSTGRASFWSRPICRSSQSRRKLGTTIRVIWPACFDARWGSRQLPIAWSGGGELKLIAIPMRLIAGCTRKDLVTVLYRKIVAFEQLKPRPFKPLRSLFRPRSGPDTHQ
ncbi:MAG: hypothetical protein M3N02_06240, partial [Pseudomonadota bacterium]|nr:hypothetical protein [Pseudomonadota bacterium]